MQPIPVWPINFYYFQWQDHDRHCHELKRVCEDLESRQKVSNVSPDAKYGLYESSFDFCEQDNDAVREFSGFVKQSMFQSASHSCRGMWPAGSNIVVELHESWCHITRDGGYHDAHIHANSSWSSIYYLDVGDMDIDSKNGVNRFYRPFDTSYTDAGQAWMTSNNTIDIIPRAGMLLTFPSWVLHSGLPYRGAASRYVISVNAKLNLMK